MSSYSMHNRAMAVLYGDLSNAVKAMSEAFVGTPGSLVERSNADGVRFYGHKNVDGDGRQRERYVAGPVGAEAADEAADDVRRRIREAKGLLRSVRMLASQGFVLADRNTYATLAAVFNAGIFQAGGVLVGSHAYGVLLNELGIQGTAYQTEDVDIATPHRLAFKSVDILDVLGETGIEFFAVPSLTRGAPSTSFKKKGRASFHVDLLVPSRGDDFATIPVPALKAHATALPMLDYLLGADQWAPVLSRAGCCPVQVPTPERFATHKVLVSQLRTGRGLKVRKDIYQAGILANFLADEHPGALEDAVEALPARGRALLRRALKGAAGALKEGAARGWEEWNDALSSA